MPFFVYRCLLSVYYILYFYVECLEWIRKEELMLKTDSFCLSGRTYCFILPDQIRAFLVCLICHQTVAVIKVFNVKRLYETSHELFAEKFTVVSKLYKSKIENLLMKYKSAT